MIKQNYSFKKGFKMNLTDLIETLKKNQKCNFVAMAITPLQAIGVDAAVSYLRDKKVVLNGYVLMAAHPDTGRVLVRENFQSDYEGIEFIDFKYEFSKKQGLIKNNQIKFHGLLYTQKNRCGGKIVYLIWTEVFSNLMYVLSQTNFKDNVVFIQVDDGAASYIGDFQLRLSNLQLGTAYEVKKKIIAYLKAGYYFAFSMIMKRNLKKRNGYIIGTIFTREKTIGKIKLCPNQMMVPYYVKAFQKQRFVYHEISRYENAVIVNTQCLAEGNITDGIVDLKIYNLFADVINDFEEFVILKPHPREKNIKKYEKIGWYIMPDFSIPQESVLACLNKKPKCIISIYSSTLLNAYGLFDIPAISLAKIMLHENISSALRKELKRYIKMYESVFYFPENKEELREIIYKILKKGSQHV